MIQLTVLGGGGGGGSFFSLGFSICHLLYMIFNKIFKIDEGKSADEMQVMSDSCDITNPFQSLKNVVAFSCRDWSANPEDAWIYGIINGWGFNEDDEGKSCTDELERKFGSNKWTKSDTKRLKVLHNNWEKAKELMAKYAKENN